MTVGKFKLPGQIKEYLKHNDSPLYSGVIMPDELEEEELPPEGIDANTWSKDQGFVRKRLEYLRSLLSRLLWDSKKHIPILAGKWHLPPNKVQSLAEEAGRQLELLQGKSDGRARETIVNMLMELATEARQNKQYIPAVTAVAKAGEFLIEPRTQKIDIQHEVKLMSDDELREQYRKEIERGARVIGGSAQNLLPSKPDFEDAVLVEEASSPEVHIGKISATQKETLESIPESPRNEQGDRVTPLLPDDGQ